VSAVIAAGARVACSPALKEFAPAFSRGGDMAEGAVGPSLIGVGARYPLAKIEKIAQWGQGRKKPPPMPSGLVSEDDASLLAAWLVSSSDVPSSEKSG
jgi:hypothetical protein